MKPIHVRQRFSHTPAEIFDAWIRPEILQTWFFRGSQSEVIQIDHDISESGKYSLTLKNGTSYIEHFGKYLDIQRPTHLAFTLSIPKYFEGESIVIVDIVETTQGCTVMLNQTGVEPRITQEAWERMLDNLKLILGGSSTPEDD